MPVTVEREVTAEELTYGDLVTKSTFGDAVGLVVKAKKFNRTRFRVTFGEYGQTENIDKSFSPDAVFTIQRDEQTAEEIAEGERRHQLQVLRYKMNRRCENRHVAILKAKTDPANYRLGTNDSPYLSHHELEQIIEDQERALAQKRLQFDLDKFIDAGVDELTAYKGVFGKALKAAGRCVQNPLSRSTSHMANLMQDVQHYVYADIAQEATRDFTADELEDALMLCMIALKNKASS